MDEFLKPETGMQFLKRILPGCTESRTQNQNRKESQFMSDQNANQSLNAPVGDEQWEIRGEEDSKYIYRNGSRLATPSAATFAFWSEIRALRAQLAATRDSLRHSRSDRDKLSLEVYEQGKTIQSQLETIQAREKCLENLTKRHEEAAAAHNATQRKLADAQESLKERGKTAAKNSQLFCEMENRAISAETALKNLQDAENASDLPLVRQDLRQARLERDEFQKQLFVLTNFMQESNRPNWIGDVVAPTICYIEYLEKNFRKLDRQHKAAVQAREAHEKQAIDFVNQLLALANFMNENGKNRPGSMGREVGSAIRYIEDLEGQVRGFERERRLMQARMIDLQEELRTAEKELAIRMTQKPADQPATLLVPQTEPQKAKNILYVNLDGFERILKAYGVHFRSDCPNPGETVEVKLANIGE